MISKGKFLLLICLLYWSFTASTYAGSVEVIRIAKGDHFVVFGSERVGYWAPRLGENGLAYINAQRADNCPEASKQRFQRFVRERKLPSKTSGKIAYPLAVLQDQSYIIWMATANTDTAEYIHFDCSSERVIPYVNDVSRELLSSAITSQVVTSPEEVWLGGTSNRGKNILTRVTNRQIQAQIVDYWSDRGNWNGSRQGGVSAGEICVYGVVGTIVCYDQSLKSRVIKTVIAEKSSARGYSDGPHRFGQGLWIGFTGAHHDSSHLFHTAAQLNCENSDQQTCDEIFLKIKTSLEESGYPEMTTPASRNVITFDTNRIFFRSVKGVFELTHEGVKSIYPVEDAEVNNMTSAGKNRILLSTKSGVFLIKVGD